MLRDLQPRAVVRTYAQLIAAFRSRADELQITRETIDAASGLQAGYSGKLLSSDPIKNVGAESLGALLGTFGLALLVVEDAAALARIQRLLSRRQRPQQRPMQAPASMAIISRKNARQMVILRVASQTPARRKVIARKAARARWNGARPK